MAEERIFIDVDAETATLLPPPRSGGDDPAAWTPWSPAGRTGPFGEAPADGGTPGAGAAAPPAALAAPVDAPLASAPVPVPAAPAAAAATAPPPSPSPDAIAARASTAPPSLPSAAGDDATSAGAPSESDAGDAGSVDAGRESRAAALLRRVPSLGRLGTLGRRGARSGSPQPGAPGHHHPAPGSATLARVGSSGHLVQPRAPSPARPPAGGGGSGAPPVAAAAAAFAALGVSPPVGHGPDGARPPLYPAERAASVSSLGSARERDGDGGAA